MSLPLPPFLKDLALPGNAQGRGTPQLPAFCRLGPELSAVVRLIPPGTPAARHAAGWERKRFLDEKWTDP